jgi:hypothetical protein
MLTLIAARIEWFHVLPLKGGTFCFPDPTSMRWRKCAHHGGGLKFEPSMLT